MQKDSLFSTSLPQIIPCVLMITILTDGGDIPLRFWLVFSWWLMMRNFSCIWWQCSYLLWKNVSQLLCPFLKLISLFYLLLLLSFMSSLYILDINLLSTMWFANIFFPHSIFCHLILLMVSLVIQNFWVWYSPICLFFMCWCWCHNQKIFARAILRRFLPMIYMRVSHFHIFTSYF